MVGFSSATRLLPTQPRPNRLTSLWFDASAYFSSQKGARLAVDAPSIQFQEDWDFAFPDFSGG